MSPNDSAARDDDPPKPDCPRCATPMQAQQDTSTGDVHCRQCQESFWLPAVLSDEDFSFLAADGAWFEIFPRTVDEAVQQLMQRLVEIGEIKNELADELTGAILKRESLGSTGIGQGVAIPHAKHKRLSDFVGVLGRAPAGVDFSSADGELVTDIFLLLSPAQRTSDHLRNLERISRCARPAAAR